MIFSCPVSKNLNSPFIFNSLRPRQNGCLFADDTFKRIFLNENIRILTNNSLKFVPKGLISNIPALVLIMAWRRPGDKPLTEPMLVRSLTHICVTRPQWVNHYVFVNLKKNFKQFGYLSSQTPSALYEIRILGPISQRVCEIKIWIFYNFMLSHDQ